MFAATGRGPRVHPQRPNSQARLGAWEAGLRAFAERPLLGWGPENFGAAYGRHASGFAARWVSHDRAHNALVETAVTTGIPGLAAWLALWAATFVVLARALPRLEPDDRARARRALERARTLAPHRAVFPAALTDPEPLAIRPAADGGRVLHWRPADGAAWHQVGVRSGDGRRHILAYLYAPEAAVFTVSAADAEVFGAATAFAVKACTSARCSAWVPWPGPESAPATPRMRSREPGAPGEREGVR